MPDAKVSYCDNGPNLSDVGQLGPALDGVVELAWRPGWAPAGLNRLVSLCARLRQCLDPAAWREAQAEMRAHPVRRLMEEDPFIRMALEDGGRSGPSPRLRDLLLGHPDSATARMQASRAGQDLFATVQALGYPAALRGQTAFLARVADAMLERRPRAEILTLSAGHLREASLITRTGDLARWVAQDMDGKALGTLRQGLPRNFPLRTLRCGLGYFIRRPYARGCFDLIMMPLLPDHAAPDQLRDLVDSAFAALKPGGHLLLGSAAEAAPEAAWMETFLGWEPHWRTSRQMAELLTQLPVGVAIHRRIFHSTEGRLVYAMVERSPA